MGLKIFNLKRHIEKYHSDVFKYFVKEEQAIVQKGNTSKQHTLSNTYREKNYRVNDKRNIQTLLFQLVVENGVPLKLFSSPCFIVSYGKMAEKLGVLLSSTRNLILCKAEEQIKRRVT